MQHAVVQIKYLLLYYNHLEQNETINAALHMFWFGAPTFDMSLLIYRMAVRLQVLIGTLKFLFVELKSTEKSIESVAKWIYLRLNFHK